MFICKKKIVPLFVKYFDNKHYSLYFLQELADLVLFRLSEQMAKGLNEQRPNGASYAGSD